MVTIDDVRKMVEAAESDAVLMKSLKNLVNPDYWLNKYYDFDIAIESEYPGLVKLWGIDLHCFKLYNRYVEEMKEYPGKQVIFQTLADAHKFAIRKDMETISEVLHMDYDDFFGLEG